MASKHPVFVVRQKHPQPPYGLVLLAVFVSEPNALLYVRNAQEADPHGVFFIDRFDGDYGLFEAEVQS